MPDHRRVDFVPEPHTDFIFRIEPENRVTRFLTWLLRPPAVLLMRVWLWAKYRRFQPGHQGGDVGYDGHVRGSSRAGSRTAELVRQSRIRAAFAGLVLTQTVHSFEEYVGRLWESFPPAAFLTGLFSSDRELTFAVLNVCLVTFGFWCLFWPVRRSWRSARTFVWGWVVLETINGIAHSAWSVRQGEYTPGVFTAPILLVLAVYLGFQLRRAPDAFSLATPS